jgi:hypothetical protein
LLLVRSQYGARLPVEVAPGIRQYIHQGKQTQATVPSVYVAANPTISPWQ